MVGLDVFFLRTKVSWWDLRDGILLHHFPDWHRNRLLRVTEELLSQEGSKSCVDVAPGDTIP